MHPEEPLPVDSGAEIRDIELVDERTRAHLLRTLLVTFAAVSAAIAGSALAVGSSISLGIAAIGGIASVGLLLALPRFGPRRIGPLCVLALFVLTTLAVATGRGIHDVGMVLYPGCLLMGVLLLRPSRLLPLTLATVAAVAGVGIAREAGLLGPPPGAPRDVLVSALLLLVFGVLTRLTVNSLQVMVADRRRAEAAARESTHELEARNEALVLVNELAHRLHRGLDLAGIAAETVAVMIRHSHPPMVAFHLLEEGGQRLRMIANHGFTDDVRALGATLPVDGSLSGMAVRERRLVSSDQVGTDPRTADGVRQALARRGVSTALIVPLCFGDDVFGTVNLLYGPSRSFSPIDLDTFQAIGQQVAVAIANVRQRAGIEHQAFHDSLTGLPNRASLHRRIGELVAAEPGGDPFGVILLDLTRFREINEALGHHSADRLLVQIGTRLRDYGAAAGTEAFRLGGDEFVILAAGLGGAAAVETTAQRVLAELRRPFEVAGMALELSASLGVSVHPVDGADSHELLRRADVAMYRAKEVPGGIARYSPEIDQNTPERLTLLGELGAAVREARLVLHYQPVVTIATGEVVGFEALVRWPHPKRGVVMPAEFIPLAETSDLIHPLTYWVVETALEQLRLWQVEHPDLTMAVNLSARNLLDRNCAQRLEEIIRRVGIDPSCLELELTETAVMTDADTALKMLGRITATGARLAIDDFGTGYSSLAYLTRFPVHTVKIDRSFIADLAGNGKSRTIVASTVELAHDLGLTVVAEGVEDIATVNALLDMDCARAQGYHFAPPAPAHIAGRLLANSELFRLED